MDITYKTEYQILSNHVGADYKARLSTLMCFFLESAYHHAVKLGVGSELLRDKHNVFWALYRIHIEMNEYPKWRDKITIETWPAGTNRSFAYRCFRIYAEDGSLLGQGITDWIIMSFETRKLADATQIFASSDLPTENMGDKLGLSNTKIRLPKENPISQIQRMTVYSDIDINNHVNSARYLDYAVDALDINEVQSKPITVADINYNAEVAVGQPIDIKVYNTEKGYIVSGEKADGTQSFTAQIKLG